jgi:DNA helicase-2/ATP-dependent DNA helicase PcrA
LDDLLEFLNPPQREAVTHIDGPLLILAGPGSGKTRVVTHRIAWMLAHGVPAHQILALTFTNKAADEMKRRVAELAPGASIWMGTFHRFCARLLRQYAPLIGLPENYTIYDTDDSRRALRQTLEALQLDLAHVTPERIQSAISWAKNQLITADRYEPQSGNPVGRVVERVYPAYQARLLQNGAVDFDDLLLHVATLLRENAELRANLDARYRYILVDEYQDTNLAQYSIVRGLSIDYPNLAVTGDPDQSIYGWRGANLNNILEFERDFPTVRVVRLEQNYRSTQRILRVADHLISHNTRRKKKGLFTENDEGLPVRMATYWDNRLEAEAIALKIAVDVTSGKRRPRDFAIFYRTNALSRTLEFALREHAIPYQMINGLEFYQRKEIKDILAYLHLVNNPRDGVALLRIINTPARSIGRSTIARLVDYAGTRKTLLEACREAGLIEGLPKRAAVSVARFVSLVDRLQLLHAAPVEQIIAAVLDQSGYRTALEDSEDPEDQERLANVEELLTAAREFSEQNPGTNQLEAFLEQACLVNDTDAWATSDDRVTLMTMHAAKGLEFPVVFVIAVEEGLLPHERSRESPDQLEEERRLLFVAVTRAREELQLSMSRYREFRGQRRYTVPSQFLMELPHHELEATELIFTPAGRARDGDLENDSETQHFSAGECDQDIAFDPAEFTAAASAPPVGRPSDSSKLRVTTAAALTGGSVVAATVASFSPDGFVTGMVVQHPEYGLGKIIDLEGHGPKRTATVQFATSGAKKFLLLHSPLAPARPV